MNEADLTKTVAPCGIICGICTHCVVGKCPGCAAGGGEDSCIQRICSREKGLVGCWECGEFPCEKGFFADEAWRGFNIGSVRAIRNMGLAVYLRRALATLGEDVDIGDYRFKTPEEIRKLFDEA